MARMAFFVVLGWTCETCMEDIRTETYRYLFFDTFGALKLGRAS